MKRAHLVAAAVTALAACLIVPLPGSAAGPPDVTCQGVFSGIAHDLIVPTGTECLVTGATITHDLVVRDGGGAGVFDTSVGNDVLFQEEAGAFIEHTTIAHDVVAGGTDSGADLIDSSVGHDFVGRGENSGTNVLRSTIGHDLLLLGALGNTHLESVTIGHDFFAAKPQTVQTGHNSPNTPGGTVSIGHDLVIEGSPDFPFVFDGFCGLDVGRDVRITDRTVNLGIGVGTNCVARGLSTNTIGRDLVLTGNSAVSGAFGPSSIGVADNRVGRDLIFTDNTAVPGGALNVAGNAAARDATCAGNNPAVTVSTPDTAGGSNTCG